MRVPSESEMIRGPGVSGITFRQAVNDPRKESLLFKIHGTSALVAASKPAQERTHLQSSGEAMRRLGHETFSEAFGLRAVNDHAFVWGKLGRHKGAALPEIWRVRCLDREPVSVIILSRPSYRIKIVGRCASAIYFRSSTTKIDRRSPSADVETDATSATVDIASLLTVEPGAPVLRIERPAYARGTVPLVFK